MRFWRGFFLVVLSMLVAHAALAQRAPVRQSFDLRVPWMPEPVVVAGKASLVYELHLTNEAQETLTIQRIEVIDEQQHVLAALCRRRTHCSHRQGRPRQRRRARAHGAWHDGGGLSLRASR